jgi:hypothetical protein
MAKTFIHNLQKKMKNYSQFSLIFPLTRNVCSLKEEEGKRERERERERDRDREQDD